MSYWTIWLIIVILLAIIEASTVNLVSVWFIVSGIISLFVSLISDSFFLQFGIFVVLGIVLMLLTRPMLEKMLQNKEEKTNLDRIIGMEGIVTSKITKNTIGEVKVDGKLWSAIADKTIKEDTVIKVKSIESVKLVVEKVEEEETKEEETKKEKEIKETKKPAAKKKTTSTKNATKKKTPSNASTKKKSKTNTKSSTAKKKVS